MVFYAYARAERTTQVARETSKLKVVVLLSRKTKTGNFLCDLDAPSQRVCESAIRRRV
jgi:hypothetical protein